MGFGVAFFAATARLVVVVLALLSATWVGAGEKYSSQSVYVEADEVKIMEQGRVSVYSGHVFVSYSSTSLRADKVELRSEGGRLTMITVWGQPATLVKQSLVEPVYASATTVFWSVTDNSVRLRGDAAVLLKQSSLTGESIDINLETQELEASGGRERVILRASPENLQ